MTREEAIENLQRLQNLLSNDAYINTQAIIATCNVAIEALKAEPCEDAISRQEVLDALDKSKYSNEFCEEHHIDWSINLGMAHIVVNELKPVTPAEKVGHWISCTVGSGMDNWECSVCGRRTRGKLENLPYCCCGAKMQEVES